VLDPLTKELIYIAASTINGCSYCVHSHTAAARAKGLSDQQHAEFLAVVGMAAETNALALQIPVDLVAGYRGMIRYKPTGAGLSHRFSTARKSSRRTGFVR
jgi:AhpD family alkylhydroperoxidase